MNEELRNLLSKNNLDEYIDVLESNKIFDISTFSMLNELDLEKMDITAMGDKKRILALVNSNGNTETNQKALTVSNVKDQRKENIKEDHSYLEAAFRKINSNINTLFDMKDQIKGILFFKTHKYTADQLLTSTQYERIRSYIEKIEDDIQRWKQSGTLSFSLRNTYNVNRDLLIERLEDLQEAIASREPTWWESVQNFFIKIFSFIVEHLRPLWNGLMLAAESLKKHPIFGPPARILLAMNKTVQKILLPKQNVYVRDEIIDE
jgi:hypothetical protein